MYLYSVKSERTAKNYLNLLNKSVKRYISELVDENAGSIYSSTSVKAVMECIAKLKANGESQKNFVTK